MRNMNEYQVMPPLSPEEYEELKADIKERGVMVPIEFDEDGNTLDGHHRLRICAELGITEYPKIIRSGMTEEEKRTHARKLNMARRHLNRAQKQELIQEELKEHPQKSDRQIAASLGIDHKTVSRQREQMESIGEIPQCDRKTSDGRVYPKSRKQLLPEIEPEAVVDDLEGQYAVEVEDGYLIFDSDTNEPVTILSAPEKKPHVTNNSKDDEWYTPEKYIEAARTVMGTIDLDPASNEFANEVVKAEKYFDESTNGLEQEWFGNIWLNPPYSTALIPKFADKITSSRFNQAIVLVNNATETAWFRKMVDNASAIVFTTGRIKFRKRDGTHGTPLQGQAIMYFGTKPYMFLNVFRQFGWGCVL